MIIKTRLCTRHLGPASIPGVVVTADGISSMMCKLGTGSAIKHLKKLISKRIIRVGKKRTYLLRLEPPVR